MDSKYTFRFEDLKIYQKAISFGESVNFIAKKFPKDERFELTSQFKRAADSVALNIAEGSAGSDAQCHKFLGLSWFSLNECVSCITKAFLRNYISEIEREELRKECYELSKMISTLRAKIKKRIEL